MNIAFLLAAGRSKRFGADKLFAVLPGGKPIIYHSLKFLEDSKEIKEIYVAVNRENKKKIEKLVKEERFKKVKKIVLGGSSRFDSVHNLLTYHLSLTTNYFLVIHNAANPFAQPEELIRCLAFLKKHKDISGVAVGRKVGSTIKKVNGQSKIEQTISRQNLWEMETPQVVRAKDFLDACKYVHSKPTDDLSVLELAGFKTAVVEASPRNKKVTTVEDLPEDYRVGIGEDSHCFMSLRGRRDVGRSNLVLGGIHIKNLPKLEANSDGDVILHALCNAIASAIGEKSLGSFATPMCKRGIHDSKKYLEKILQKMDKKGFKICNCSISIEAVRPKIDPLAPEIKKSLGKLLKIPADFIGITATSGTGKGIKCLANVLLIH